MVRFLLLAFLFLSILTGTAGAQTPSEPEVLVRLRDAQIRLGQPFSQLRTHAVCDFSDPQRMVDQLLASAELVSANPCFRVDRQIRLPDGSMYEEWEAHGVGPFGPSLMVVGVIGRTAHRIVVTNTRYISALALARQINIPRLGLLEHAAHAAVLQMGTWSEQLKADLGPPHATRGPVAGWRLPESENWVWVHVPADREQRYGGFISLETPLYAEIRALVRAQ